MLEKKPRYIDDYESIKITDDMWFIDSMISIVDFCSEVEFSAEILSEECVGVYCTSFDVRLLLLVELHY